MKSQKRLEALILADVLLSVLSVVWDDAMGVGARLRPDNLSFVLWVAVCAGTVLAWIGLLHLIDAARSLYAASWIGYLALAALRAPVTGSSVGSVLDLLAGLVGGMILAVVYFSELSARFHPIGPPSREVLPSG